MQVSLGTTENELGKPSSARHTVTRALAACAVLSRWERAGSAGGGQSLQSAVPLNLPRRQIADLVEFLKFLRPASSYPLCALIFAWQGCGSKTCGTPSSRGYSKPASRTMSLNPSPDTFRDACSSITRTFALPPRRWRSTGCRHRETTSSSGPLEQAEARLLRSWTKPLASIPRSARSRCWTFPLPASVTGSIFGPSPSFTPSAMTADPSSSPPCWKALGGGALFGRQLEAAPVV